MVIALEWEVTAAFCRRPVAPLRRLLIVRVVLVMEFEWDPTKHERNLRTRGIGFDEASLIFEGEVIEWPDTRTDRSG